jgi:hypothetical protein
MENYKIFEGRAELTKEQVAEGVDFNSILRSASVVPKFSFKTIGIVGLVSIALTIGLVYYLQHPNTNPPKKEIIPIDTLKHESPVSKIDSVISDTQREVHSIIKEKVEIKKDTTLPRSEVDVKEIGDYPIPFEKLPNADSRYAIPIMDSIYGPTNVSQGYGNQLEYRDKIDPNNSEKNSAWFKFIIEKDTLLTLHIVPKLANDDYDFILYKLDEKLEIVRSCFSYNSGINKNTGLSNLRIDTTFQAQTLGGSSLGRTYAPALKVKKGDTFYLLINNSMQTGQEPEGFIIYFYNYLPKSKFNKYKK